MGDKDLSSHSPDELDTSIDEQTATADADTAASSTAETEGERSLLDVVRDAAPETEDDEPASPAGDDASTDTPEGGDEADTAQTDQAEPDDENFTDAPFHKHPRFKKLIAQRDQYKAGAQQYEQVQSYLRENGLSGDDAAQALRMQALLKRDKAAAWAELKPIVQQLLVDVGEILPADLKEQVQRGQLSREAALEVSRARALQGSVQSQRQHDQQVAQQQQAHAQSQAMQQAAADWEAQARRDPDFSVVEEDVQREVLWLQRQHGRPQDAQGVRKMLDDAYQAVKSRRKPAERKPAVQSLRSGRSAGGTPTSAPKSVLEIVQRGG